MDEENGVLEIDERFEGEGEGLIVDVSEENEGSFVEWLNVDVSEGNKSSFVEGLNIDSLEENEGSFVEWLNVDVSEGNKSSFVEGLNIDGSEDNEVGNIDVVEDVEGVVCPWQLPLLIETSSIAKSPV